MNELEDTEWSPFQISGFLSVRRSACACACNVCVSAWAHVRVRVPRMFTLQCAGMVGRVLEREERTSRSSFAEVASA